MAAAEALGEIGDPQAIEPLLNILQSNDSWRLRRTAIEAFAKIKDPVVVDPLITALQDRYASLREAAALALGEIGDPRSIQPLLAALENNKLWTLRWAATQALGALGSVEAVPPLITLLKDAYSNVREAAARALGNIGSPLAITPLLRATKDRDSMVRMAADRALETLGRSLPPTDRDKLQVAIATGDPNASPFTDLVSAFPVTALTTRVIAERAVQILEALLKDRQANIDPEILRQILHLNDQPHTEQSSEDTAALTAAISQPLDCSGLIQLAQKALLRSGFDV
jgi:HEAT repeat protein